jgi:phage-related protein
VKTLAADLIIEKNQLYSANPWIALLAVDVDGTDTWRLAAYPEDVTWNGETWTAFPIYLEQISEAAAGRLDGLNIHVANVNQVVSAYIETGSILGNDVTVYFVNKAYLDITSDIPTYTYRVNRISTTETVALFELGHNDLIRLQWPWQRFVRDRCRFPYKGTRCGYPNDEFHNISEQDLVAGGDVLKYGGWNALNTANASALDINQTYENLMSITTAAGGPFDWDDATRTGPFAYKTFTGDFDFYVLYDSAPTSNAGGLFLVQSTTDADDWIGIGSIEVTGTDSKLIRNTTNGSSVDWTESTVLAYWRIVRSDSVFTFYMAANDALSWYQIAQETRTDIPTTVRVGLASYTTDSSAGHVQAWNYFRAYSGGLATCDHTLDGANGCRAHEHSRNYGGFPALPYGRYSAV